MIKLRYIHLVCGFCQVYGTCRAFNCSECPVNKLEEIAKKKLSEPTPPQEPEDEQEDE